jgi:hypothetical protein
VTRESRVLPPAKGRGNGAGNARPGQRVRIRRPEKLIDPPSCRETAGKPFDQQRTGVRSTPWRRDPPQALGAARDPGGRQRPGNSGTEAALSRESAWGCRVLPFKSLDFSVELPRVELRKKPRRAWGESCLRRPKGARQQAREAADKESPPPRKRFVPTDWDDIPVSCPKR